MNRAPEQPKEAEAPKAAPAPEPEPKPTRRELRAARAEREDEKVKAETLALVPGGAGIAYLELLEASGMTGEELQEELDELEAEGKIRRAVVNDTLCYVHA